MNTNQADNTQIVSFQDNLTTFPQLADNSKFVCFKSSFQKLNYTRSRFPLLGHKLTNFLWLRSFSIAVNGFTKIAPLYDELRD